MPRTSASGTAMIAVMLARNSVFRSRGAISETTRAGIALAPALA